MRSMNNRDALAGIPPLKPIMLAGQIMPLTEDGRMSGIAKTRMPGPWTIVATGLVGDAQADSASHGGPEMALHQYPFDHYRAWRDDIGAHPLLQAVGGFGENLSTTGWTESSVHIGDIVSLGPVVMQVSQGRQPCWKLNARFGRKTMALDVQTTGRTGWYYRVLEPGIVLPGDVMRIVDRPCRDWPLRRLIDVLYKRVDDSASLEEMAEMPALAENWRLIAQRRLASGRTEDWTRRLEGRGAA